MCARPAYRSLRLNHVQTAEDGELAMFLTANWGLMADIDLGSERFRWAGMIRLHIEAFIRIASKSYKLELTFYIFYFTRTSSTSQISWTNLIQSS
jgi:hypothetical protein